MLHSFEQTRQGLPHDDEVDELDQLGQILQDAKRGHEMKEANQSMMMMPSNLVYPHEEER